MSTWKNNWRVAAASVIVNAVLVASASAQLTSHWASVGTEYWTNGANWSSTPNYPGESGSTFTNAFFTNNLGSAASIILDRSTDVQRLLISNSTASSTVTLNVNAGTLTLRGSGSGNQFVLGSNATLNIASGARFIGETGAARFDDNPAINIASGATLDWRAGNFILEQANVTVGGVFTQSTGQVFLRGTSVFAVTNGGVAFIGTSPSASINGSTPTIRVDTGAIATFGVDLTTQSSGMTITNAGTLRVTGLLDVKFGNLAMTAGSLNAGSITFADANTTTARHLTNRVSGGVVANNGQFLFAALPQQNINAGFTLSGGTWTNAGEVILVSSTNTVVSASVKTLNATMTVTNAGEFYALGNVSVGVIGQGATNRTLSGTLEVRGAGGKFVSYGNMNVGTINATFATNTFASATLWVDGGSVFITNAGATATLHLGDTRAATATLHNNGGAVNATGIVNLVSGNLTVDRLMATNGTLSQVNFSGGTLKVKNNLIFAGTNTLSGNQVFTIANGSTLELGGGVHSFANGLSNSAGGALIGAGIVTGNVVNVFGGSVIATNGTLRFVNIISGAGTNFAAASGTLALEGVNTFTGPTVLKGGTVVITNDSNLGATSAALVFNNGGTLLSSGNATLDASRTVTLGSAGGVFSVTSQTTVVQGALGGAGGFTKSGAGTLTLLGNSTYSGATTVEAGTLIISNVTGTGVIGSGVTLAGGTLTVNNTGSSIGVGTNVTIGATGRLKGVGTISGMVTLNSSGTLAPGNSSAGTYIGTINVGSLTLTSGAMDLEVAGGSNDKIKVNQTNGLFINGGGVNLLQEGTGTTYDTRGLYNLIEYTGSIGGVGVGGLSVLNAVNNRVYTFGTAGGFVTVSIGGSVGWAPSMSSANSYWSNADNWGGTPLQEYDVLLFDGNTRLQNTNDFTSHTRFSGIVFTNTANAFTLRGLAAGTNIVNLTGDVINRSANTQTIALPLQLEGGSRKFNASNANLIVTGVISGVDSSVGLIKQGSKVLELTGANTYSGITEIVSGTLRANSGAGLPSASNLKINGGILEGIGAVTLSRTLGTGTGSLQWAGDGGFAANGGKLTVNLGGTVIWDTSSFVPAGNTLVFGSTTANNEVEFVSPIDLNGGPRTIRVDDNPGSSGDFATLKAGLSNGSLTKAGTGKLVLDGNSSFSGTLLVNAGTLIVNGSLAGGSDLSLSFGTTLGGTGTIGRIVAGSGTVAPGLSPGILTVNQVNPSANLGFNFEFTNIGSPDYTQPGASSNDVLRLTNATPFTVALGMTNTVNLYINTTLVSGVTNEFRGGFYTDNSANFDGSITSATYNVYINNVFAGAPVFVRTVDETSTQFGGINGRVMEFGVLNQTLAAVVPEPNVLLMWLAGAVTVWAARRRQRHGHG